MAAYRHPDRRTGKADLATVITSITHGVPVGLPELARQHRVRQRRPDGGGVAGVRVDHHHLDTVAERLGARPTGLAPRRWSGRRPDPTGPDNGDVDEPGLPVPGLGQIARARPGVISWHS